MNATVFVKCEVGLQVKGVLPVEIAYFHRWKFGKNLLKFTPIMELKLTNFGLGSKMNECISVNQVSCFS